MAEDEGRARSQEIEGGRMGGGRLHWWAGPGAWATSDGGWGCLGAGGGHQMVVEDSDNEILFEMRKCE